ncbi:hypothetical protein BH23VER1_BH23VER1_12740 [soil metagenome]
MMDSLDHLRELLADPEFLALVLEPVLFWGPALGLVLFLSASVCKEGKSQKLALVVILVSCAAAVPLAHLYGLALPRLQAVSDLRAAGLAEAHLARLDQFQYAFLAVSALATLALFLGRGGRTGLWLTLLTLAAAAGAVVLGLWLFGLSAQVTHPVL